MHVACIVVVVVGRVVVAVVGAVLDVSGRHDVDNGFHTGSGTPEHDAV